MGQTGLGRVTLNARGVTIRFNTGALSDTDRLVSVTSAIGIPLWCCRIAIVLVAEHPG